MNTTQAEALIGTLTVLGMLLLVALPALIGVARDRRIDRQIREAQERNAAVERPDTAQGVRTAAREASCSHRIARAA
ncbi:hypothetical protein [Streptomyces graminofaciens]|nr:hypothetical protein [Streptomyces graminofaciens]